MATLSLDEGRDGRATEKNDISDEKEGGECERGEDGYIQGAQHASIRNPAEFLSKCSQYIHTVGSKLIDLVDQNISLLFCNFFNQILPLKLAIMLL